jgi:hypothetical protein
MVAWKPEGSPIKDFVLDADATFEAGRQLVAGGLKLRVRPAFLLPVPMAFVSFHYLCTKTRIDF